MSKAGNVREKIKPDVARVVTMKFVSKETIFSEKRCVLLCLEWKDKHLPVGFLLSLSKLRFNVSSVLDV